MNLNPPLKTIAKITMIVLGLMMCTNTQAQYCSPAYSMGCTSWMTKMVVFDSDTLTTDTTDCTLFDFTTDTVVVAAGDTISMTIVNANWCGCGVWIDFNNDFALDSTENFYHTYNASAINVYTFDIIIPTTATAGTYRMRTLSGWGSDCYSPSTNGYGACGSYQYGNFQDYSLKIPVVVPPPPSSIQPMSEKTIRLKISPNPASNLLFLEFSETPAMESQITIRDLAGKTVLRASANSMQERLDISDLAHGMYVLTYSSGNLERQFKIMK